MRRALSWAGLWLAAAVLAHDGFGCCRALKVQVTAAASETKVRSVEEFGFVAGGELHLEVRRFELSLGGKIAETEPNLKAGVVLLRADTEAGVLKQLHAEMKEVRGARGVPQCPLNDPNVKFKLEFGVGAASDLPKRQVLQIEAEGIYEVVLVNCAPAGSMVTYELVSEMFNPGPSYLPAGETPLPGLLFFFFAVYLGFVVAWVMALRRHKQHSHKVHHLMTAFLALKVLSTFCFAMEKHFVSVYGYSVAWSFLYHAFRALRAVMFMLVVVLIGTGWSILKPALTDRDRKVLLFVLPLQLLANVFLAVADEMPEGSSSFRYWKFLFVWVDLLCCLAILFPIWQHIKQLESHAGIANKQAVNLQKLKKFRTILLAVVAFVYVTRFLVFVLGKMLNFKLLYWLVIVREVATIVFYLALARMLFPRADSAYLRASTRDPDENEYETVGGMNGHGMGMTSGRSEASEDPFDQDMFYEDEHHSEFGLNADVEMAGLRPS